MYSLDVPVLCVNDNEFIRIFADNLNVYRLQIGMYPCIPEYSGVECINKYPSMDLQVMVDYLEATHDLYNYDNPLKITQANQFHFFPNEEILSTCFSTISKHIIRTDHGTLMKKYSDIEIYNLNDPNNMISTRNRIAAPGQNKTITGLDIKEPSYLV